MAPGVKVLTTKPVRVSPTPGPRVVGEEAEPLKLSSDLRARAVHTQIGKRKHCSKGEGDRARGM